MVKISQKQMKKIPFFVGILFILSYAAIVFFEPAQLHGWIDFLEKRSYDLQLQYSYKPPLKSDHPVIIIDIDDRSLEKEGHWPWPRKKIATLVEKLYAQGAKVVAFDIAFPESQPNIVQEVITKLKSQEPPNPAVVDLEKIKEDFNEDALLAKSLGKGNSILGIVFLSTGNPVGSLPISHLKLPAALLSSLSIPNMPSYIGNLPLLQAKAKSAGFINAFPDSDGILRVAPLLLRHDDAIYSSLALESAKAYLSSPQESFVVEPYKEGPILEKIQLGTIAIPVDSSGQILIPFRGRSYTFPYFSATDILEDRVPKQDITGKLIFIGSTATALGDLHPTAITSVFPGIEIHATIASGIIEGYLPYQPTWGKGAGILMILVFGLVCACLFPRLQPLSITLTSIFVLALLIGINRWVWVKYGIVLPTVLPILAIILLFILALLGGYFLETRSFRSLRGLFHQYVSPVYIDKMFQEGATVSLMGESKELSVLFSDIRGFTSLSERLTAPELKAFLDLYFTKMTQAVFDTQGTIDKYVGDALMAFWGAPLDHSKHAFAAVNTALQMQKEIIAFNQTIQEKHFPQIQIGIGVNTGTMVVGDMGSKFRRNYTVIGDSVNLASRLEGLTKLYHINIIVGQTTYHQTKQDFIYRKIDKVKVKGKTVAVDIYQPLCLVAENTETLQKQLKKHTLALQYYFEKNWKEAISLFEQLVVEDLQNKLLYEVYLERMRAAPPPEGWDGSYMLLEK